MEHRKAPVAVSTPSAARSGSAPLPDEPASPGLTFEQKARTERLIQLFEYGTTEITPATYAAVSNLDDGRGYTCGRAGFTTATGDWLLVVELYAKKRPGHLLEKYLPCLRELARSGSDEVSGLEAMAGDAGQASGDPEFRRAQDEIMDRLTYQPSRELADAAGLVSGLSRAVLFDSVVQHGDGDDYDGAPALLERTRLKVGGTPASGVDEHAWLLAFLSVRRASLAHAADPATRAAWAESVGRVDVWRQIAEAGNWELKGPITIKTAEYDEVVP